MLAPLTKFLLSLPRPVKRGLVLSSDVFLSALTVWIALALRFETFWLPAKVLAVPIVLAISLSIPLFVARGLYRQIFRFSGVSVIKSLAQVVAIYGLIYFLIFGVIAIEGVPRSVGLTQPMFFFAAAAFSRLLLRWLIQNQESSAWSRSAANRIIVIYGAGSAGQQLARAIQNSDSMRFLAFVDDDKKLWNQAIDHLRVLPPTSLGELAKRDGATEVWLAMPSLTPDQRLAVIESLRHLPLRVRTLPNVTDLISGRVRLSDVRDLDLDELLGREKVAPNQILLNKDVRNRVVLITGAGGSIGAELCRQILLLNPKRLVILDHSEYALYRIHSELVRMLKATEVETDTDTDTDTDTEDSRLVPVLASVRDESQMRAVFLEHQPEVVYHAAAYKHVPMVEHNQAAGILNNVLGTYCCATLAREFEVKRFVLISTDKAVRPTSVMGASKRLAEMVLQVFADQHNGASQTCFTMVRFGNVLGSSGSVVPLFRKQIDNGGPVTLTHPEVTRYFMSITEASQLVIQAGSMARGGEVFLLDMGNPVRILDLAIRMIELSGLRIRDEQNPQGDIEIKVTGLRPGEKLYEELLIGNNPLPTQHPKIMKAEETFIPSDDLMPKITKLKTACESNESNQIRQLLLDLIPEYSPDLSSEAILNAS